MQRRYQLARVALAQGLGTDILVQQQFQPVEQFRCRGLLLEAGRVANFKEHSQRLLDEPLLDAGEMHIDDLFHRLAIREGDVVKETTAQERVRQFLLVVGGDDDDGPPRRLHRLAGFVNVKLHAIEFEQQIVGKLDVGLVDFIDQEHWSLRAGEGLPQLAAPDVIRDVADAWIAKLAVAQARHGVVFIKSLLGL